MDEFPVLLAWALLWVGYLVGRSRKSKDPFKVTHTHRGGGEYQWMGEGRIEKNLTPVTIYRAADLTLWVRSTEEFNDGRFTPKG